MTAERGILFKDRLVRAILEGRKTQTRRLVKPQPPAEGWNPVVGRYNPTIIRRGMEAPGPEVFGASDEDIGRVCPYGETGGRLWVREAWMHLPVEEAGHLRNLGMALNPSTPFEGVVYRADCYEPAFTKLAEAGRRWKPSIHLARRDARLLLDVVNVRVERLQDITAEDAIAEGLEQVPGIGEEWTPTWRGAPPSNSFEDPRRAFETLWDGINGARPGASWNGNPWVWAVTFKRVS